MPAERPPRARRTRAAADPWRSEVLRVTQLRPRYSFALGVHLGRPGGQRASYDVGWEDAAAQDAGLRFDLAEALVVRAQAAGTADASAPWLTRPGVPEPHDLDHGWHAAFLRAAAAHDLGVPGLRVVTRTGWYDIETGERRVWRRLRVPVRPSSAAASDESAAQE